MSFIINNLTITHPELAKEWHPTKNGNLRPENVTAGSNRKVWWYLPYNDLKTGKHFDFEWEDSVYNRTGEREYGCPYLSGRAVQIGFNDLSTTHPELAKEWHPFKNGDLKPIDVTAGNSKKVWWLYKYYDSVTRKHFNFEWEASINNRTNGRGCPYLVGRAVWVGYNDLLTTHPEIAAEWHPFKNGYLKPYDVMAGSGKKVWWKKSYDDLNTGKHFDFEWEASINNRTKGRGCPYLAGKAVWVGYNDLLTTHPELAKEWHPFKNGDLKPIDVTVGVHRKVWWYFPYDDLKTGKHFDFEWEASINNRVKYAGCPYLAGRAVWVGYNDLLTTHPELAKEWHPFKNGDLKPIDVTAGCHRAVWWKISYHDLKTDKYFDYEWKAVVYNRAKGVGCPFLTSSKLEIITYNILKDFGCSFKTEKMFQKCKDKNKLRFDIYLVKNKKIIELDGMQHFVAIDIFGGDDDFVIRKYHDEIKDNFCRDNNIPLLRIPYIYDSVNDKEEIVSIIDDFINYNVVPEKIRKFYKEKQRISYIKLLDEMG